MKRLCRSSGTGSSRRSETATLMASGMRQLAGTIATPFLRIDRRMPGR